VVPIVQQTNENRLYSFGLRTSLLVFTLYEQACEHLNITRNICSLRNALMYGPDCSSVLCKRLS